MTKPPFLQGLVFVLSVAAVASAHLEGQGYTICLLCWALAVGAYRDSVPLTG